MCVSVRVCIYICASMCVSVHVCTHVCACVRLSIPYCLFRVPTGKVQKELMWMGAGSRILPSGAIMGNMKYGGHPKYMANSESLEPVNVILRRNSILADMIKDLEMRSSWIPCGL